MKNIIALDIGGTNFRIGTVNDSLEVNNIDKFSSSFLKEDNSITKLIDIISSYIKKYKINNLQAITIGVPSMVSKDRKKVICAPNLPGLVDIDLADILSNELNIQVEVDRDVNYLLLADIYKYNLDPNKNKNIIGYYIGTGIGNPIWINGSIYRGKNGVAGELAHIPYPGNMNKCPCGNTGCVETIASGKALQQIKKTHFQNTHIDDLFTYHSTDKSILSFIDKLSVPLATEITILDPDLIILSSGVINMKNFPRDIFLDNVKKYVKHPLPANNIEYFFTDGNDEKGLIGGAISQFKNI